MTAKPPHFDSARLFFKLNSALPPGGSWWRGVGGATKRTGRQAYRETKLAQAVENKLDRLDRLQEHLMFDHISKKLDRSKVYTCPAGLLQLTALTGFLDEPASKRRRGRDGGAVLRPEGDLLNEDPEGISGPPSDTVHFKLLHSSIGKKKTVHIALGAGGRLREEHILVSVHNRLQGFGDDVVISSRAASASADTGPAFVLHGFGSIPKVQVEPDASW